MRKTMHCLLLGAFIWAPIVGTCPLRAVAAPPVEAPDATVAPAPDAALSTSANTSTSPPALAYVTVTSNVPGEVFIDGAPVGPTPYTGSLQPGFRSVEVRAEGCETHRIDFAMAAGQTYPINALLTHVSDASGSDDKSYWIGVVVVGAAVVGLVVFCALEGLSCDGLFGADGD